MSFTSAESRHGGSARLAMLPCEGINVMVGHLRGLPPTAVMSCLSRSISRRGRVSPRYRPVVEFGTESPAEAQAVTGYAVYQIVDVRELRVIVRRYTISNWGLIAPTTVADEPWRNVTRAPI